MRGSCSARTTSPRRCAGGSRSTPRRPSRSAASTATGNSSRTSRASARPRGSSPRRRRPSGASARPRPQPRRGERTPLDASARERIVLRSPDEIERIGAACALVHEVLDLLVAAAVPGVTTSELDRLAVERTRARGAAARTVPVGRVAPEALRLIDVGREALARAIAAARPGGTLGDVGAAVQRYVEGEGFSVVRDFVGHGIGRRLHEPPQVPNVGTPGAGERLLPGIVLAIEPMVNAGAPEVEQLDDGWTAVTADGSLSAHFEHTVAITENGPEILGLQATAAAAR